MTTKEQVLQFLGKCEEMGNCKFIMATTKIKDLLKCIVNCPDLYELFSTVTDNFDYMLFKSKCLVTVNDGVYSRSYIVMPKTIGHVLAFVFCLLVEFDTDAMNFSEFLQRYFREDGSYYSSYHAFCNTIIAGLAEALKQVFKEDLESEDPVPAPLPEQFPAQPVQPVQTAQPAQPFQPQPLQPTQGAEDIGAFAANINALIYAEQQFVLSCTAVSADERTGALEVLDRLAEAVTDGNCKLINALVFGYNCFLLCNGLSSENMPVLVKLITDFERLI